MNNSIKVPKRQTERHKHIFNQTIESLSSWLEEQSEPRFKAKQIIHWVHHEQVLDPNLMTNLSKRLRDLLSQTFNWNLLNFSAPKISQDKCVKWLLKLEDENVVECVFIPEANRGTLCISSQSGCALACKFCHTGTQGFSGNLTMGEIIGQVWMAKHLLKSIYPERKNPITNVVLMGMGEPLLNAKAATDAVNLMLNDLGYGLSKYKVTLSTSGIVPAMYKLKEESDCALAVSLHAANDALRSEIMPINKKYPLKELIACCNQYYNKHHKRKITIEYAMLKGVNDQMINANELIKLLANCPCKINLIPFNPFPGTLYEASSKDTIIKFQRKLQNAGYNVTIRKTRGIDIDAACGQLAGDVLDMTTRTPSGIIRRKKYQSINKPDKAS